VVLFVRDNEACGPGYFYTWDGEDERGGALWGANELGDTIMIWIVEIDGERFMIAAEWHLNAEAELVAEVQQIVDSIEFGPAELHLGSDYTPGRHATTVDGTAFSFEISTRGWEPYPWVTPAGILISKSSAGSQEAEEVIYWAGYPDSVAAARCGILQDPARPPTALGVASRVATAPGVVLGSGPELVTVGSHPAAHVVVEVSENVGCDPGFFYGWEPQRGGAFWTATGVGTTIRVWVVEVDAGLLFIGAVTDPSAAVSEEEIQRIIDSIEFD
jgi:hypothetical protein